jgi:cell division protein FtsQ
VGSAFAEVRPYVLPVLAFTFLALAVLVVHQGIDRFLAADPRFRLRKADFGEPHSPDLTVSGVQHASIADIRRVFAEDEGRSVYLTPLDERRTSLNGIDWVRDASVQRLWPNRIAIEIVERSPVFRAEIASSRQRGVAKLASVDEAGKILPGVKFPDLDKLPLMTGVSTQMSDKDIADRVRLMRRVIEEIGEEGKPVTEIDVADTENVKLLYPVFTQGKNRVLTLVVGESLWRQRLMKFLYNWAEIEKRMPRAVKLDLRIDGRINAVAFEEPEPAEPARAGKSDPAPAKEEAKEPQRGD